MTAFAVAMAVLIATPLAVVATDRFADVPNNNPHHNDITWLADAAATLGCNPPANTNYCPDQPVRRDQMASFLRRLAENQVVHAATAIEAENAATAIEAESAATAIEAANAIALGDVPADFILDRLPIASASISRAPAVIGGFGISMSRIRRLACIA